MKTSDGQFDDSRPVNRIVLPFDTIKAYDTDTEFKVELFNKDQKADVDNIAFFVLANSKDEFTSVTDYTVDSGEVTFKIPQIKEDHYYPQIMDDKGRVYSSDNNAFIDVVYNPVSRTMELFPIIKEEVIRELAPQIKQYVMDNKEQFTGLQGKQGVKGDKGDPGAQGQRGLRGNRGEKGDKGDKGDPGEKGEKGDRGLRGNRGEKGERGAVDFEALTPEEIAILKGEKGDKGDKGDPGQDGSVNFEELTQEQLDLLKPEFELDENGDLYIIK